MSDKTLNYFDSTDNDVILTLIFEYLTINANKKVFSLTLQKMWPKLYLLVFWQVFLP